MDKRSVALTVLDQIEQGCVDPDLFTANGTWWSNAGLSLPLQDFNSLLRTLHDQTENGIAVTAGPAFIFEEILFVEATSKAALVNGKQYSNRYVFVFRFDGDHISEVREYSDTAHVYETFDISL